MLLNKLSSLLVFDCDLNSFKSTAESFSTNKLASLVKNDFEKSLKDLLSMRHFKVLSEVSLGLLGLRNLLASSESITFD